jgi:hypothetical protein
MNHSFSIEIKSKKHVRNISISDEDYQKVLFEGALGELKSLSHIERRMLEIKGSYGTIRIDLNEAEMNSMKLGPDLPCSEVGSNKNTNQR